MPKAKEVKEEVKVAKKAESEEKKAFRALIATYKEQNPEKYEMKKEALEAKLETL